MLQSKHPRSYTAAAGLHPLCPNQVYQTAYAGLLAGIRERKGFVLLTGAEGTGKTTLLGQLVNHVDPLVRYLFFDGAAATNATFADVLHFMCTELELSQDGSGHLQKLQALSAYLVARSKEGEIVALVVDGAHNLTDEALGNLRSLSPPDTDTDSDKPLLQVVLAGPPQLEGKLDHPKLRPLKHRIALRCRLQGLDEREVAFFIHHRLCTVDSERQALFTSEALRRVAVYSKGVPGLINSIWDKALPLASEAFPQTVSAVIIDDVARTLRLLPEPADPFGDLRKETAPPGPGPGEDNTADKAFAATPIPQPPRQPQRQDLIGADCVPTATSLRVPWVFLLSGVALLVLLVGGLLYYYQRPAPMPTPALPRLPQITRATPPVHPGQDLVVAEGQRLTFAIEATNLQPWFLQYVWFLNGHEQARGAYWTYEPRFDEGGPIPKTVTAQVIDGENHVVERNWQVRVQDVNRPPTITAVFPSVPTVEVTAGQEQRFALEAVDPDTDDQLTYSWAVDGEEVARGRHWAFAPAATATKGEHTVVASISDKAGSTLARQWTVTVTLAPLRPPLIVRATPAGKELTVAEGQTLMFDVEATSAQPEPLQYVWLLDGRARAQGPRWSYRPGFDEGGAAPRAVTVRVTDRERHAAERTWQLSIQEVNRPPAVTTASPAARTLTMHPGAEQNFSIRAADPDKDDRLAFVWSLDGREVARGEENWRFRSPSTPSADQPHQVRVEVADGGGLRDRLTWNVVVKQPAPPPPPPSTAAARPPTAASPPRSLVSRKEVWAWLEAHRQALEERDVDRLVELGAVASPQAERARSILSGYKSFHVILQDVEIQISANRATTSFLRVDTIDGRIVPHPNRTVLIFEKGVDGRLTARPQ